MTVYGFGNADDMARVVNAALGVEGRRAPDRGRSRRQPAISSTVLFRARTRSSFPKNSSQVCDVLIRNDAGDLVANGQEIEVYNMWGTIQANKSLLCVLLHDGCEIVTAECT